MTAPALLIIDDNQDILLSLRLLLKSSYSDLTVADNPRKIGDLCRNKRFDIVILDMNFTRDAESGEEGFSCLKELLSINPAVKVIFITAYGDIDKAVRAIKAGAFDFILKPWQNDKILEIVGKAVLACQTVSEQPANDFHGLTVNSGSMQKIIRQIKQVAPTEANVLILGENGTGKEVAARAIWQESKRQNGIFLSVDLGSLNETLLESELFGHVKGAFTDAKEERCGRFEAADGGTIFLDEIGNLPLSGQSKLLTAIEKKEICRLGSYKTVKTDVRIIAATNADLSKSVVSGQFRRDLFYRLNTVAIQLPPLRERREDIIALADLFIHEFSRKYAKNITLPDEKTRSALMNYDWPGNIRELKHAMERAVILNSDGLFKIEECGLTTDSRSAETPAVQTLEELEKEQITSVMHRVQGNISQAAKELGLTRASLYRRLEKYGVH